jgi:sphingolipid delta-4 desaturase
MVLVNFIRDPNVGIFARAKRVPVGSSTVAPPSVKKANEDEDKSE